MGNGQTALTLGPGGVVLDVPENAEFLTGLNGAPRMTPQELLRRAETLYKAEATRGLATHLAFLAMRQILEDQGVQAAAAKVAGEEVGFSLFGDIWGAIVGFFTGTNPNQPQGTPNPGAPWPCQVQCWGEGIQLMLERCATGVGDNYGPWHVIGVCIGFSF